jgi:hypothetical protein
MVAGKNKLGIIKTITYLYMMKKFKTSELLILAMTIIVIFISEYHFLVENDVNKAIFIGLWPPTILSLLNYFNSKTNNK